jgi:hypothetical protein
LTCHWHQAIQPPRAPRGCFDYSAIQRSAFKSKFSASAIQQFRIEQFNSPAISDSAIQQFDIQQFSNSKQSAIQQFSNITFRNSEIQH